MSPNTTLGQQLPVLSEDVSSWKGASVLSVTQMTPGGLALVFEIAHQMRMMVQTQGADTRCQGKLLATVFYEASTRTACSFQAAMMRLGGNYLHVDGEGGNSSAAKKGESLTDTIRCLECYTDVTVLRHYIKGSVGTVIEAATKPVINAGDGVGEHPTQALLDVFTIYDELKLPLSAKATANSKPLTIVLLGDLKHGRTVHSLAKLLAKSHTAGVVLRYCAPDGLELPEEIQEYVAQFDHVLQETVTDLREACQQANILYVTRVQRERFESDEAYQAVKGSYVVDTELMQQVPSDMIVLHPLPRIDEIDPAVDSDPRAAYFREMENGMYVRMALLALVLGKV
ncbi:aspartate carbamoyltransferase catalytic subunit [Fistulifera solaris]|uniref:aspartate carbamoyltransferase n=1 Tax=Fistulifera solaris TaxID=1519565 RepID=A0A1Z5JIZ1_FISSO|nr:aspartate carbamoyltransferase catalytic subunit [Fistulifera solaris]|eukprot:GAX13990.1 aspartate carbamoyltransferase catalytic subunit [Fistulifera solaris]